MLLDLCLWFLGSWHVQQHSWAWVPYFDDANTIIFVTLLVLQIQMIGLCFTFSPCYLHLISFDLAESFSMTLPSLADSIMTRLFVRVLYL